MSETLEIPSFTRDQSDAFIQSTALAIKTFAVTPKILDDRLNKLSHELRRDWKRDLEEHKADSNRRFDGIDNGLAAQEASMEEVKQAMIDLQRTLQRYFLGFTLTVLVGLLGIFGTLLTP